MWKGRPALDLATVRDFLRFHASCSRGRLDANGRITAESLVTFAEWFFAAYSEVTEIDIAPDDRTAVFKAKLPYWGCVLNLADINVISGYERLSLMRVSS